LVTGDFAVYLQFTLRINIEISLHVFHDRVKNLGRLQLDYQLEGESFQEVQLGTHVRGAFVDWDPDLEGVVVVLAVGAG